ncbi:MAG: hypothetical protein NT003_01810 [Candidatus Magasanikbacteria bacterium]|nr:hypothetical protein [Candidatus Magasanikbacteria bacterium]
MWFLIVFLLGISPRIVLALLWILTNYTRALPSALWGFVGFLFMPWTTLWCAYVYNNGADFGPLRTIVLIICVCADLFGGRHTVFVERY